MNKLDRFLIALALIIIPLLFLSHDYRVWKLGTRVDYLEEVAEWSIFNIQEQHGKQEE
jgi:hypothetical protein